MQLMFKLAPEFNLIIIIVWRTYLGTKVNYPVVVRGLLQIYLGTMVNGLWSKLYSQK